MKQSRYPFHTASLQINLALAILCLILWHKWRASDSGHRATLSDLASLFYVTR